MEDIKKKKKALRPGSGPRHTMSVFSIDLIFHQLKCMISGKLYHFNWKLFLFSLRAAHTEQQQSSIDSTAQGLLSRAGCSNSEHNMATETHTKTDPIDF